jgi:hypothetical protein
VWSSGSPSLLRVVSALLVAGACMASADAAARDLYKWTDKDGKVQYSDQPPKGFSGEVTRIEIDTNANTRPPGAPPRAAPDAVDDTAAPQQVDVAKKRRELRTQLEERLRRARERVEAAQAALDEGGTPQVEERQVVQQRFDRPQAGRSNCRTAKSADGKNSVMCPALVPNDSYYERQGGLEAALKAAEEELAAAEQAYRRGVD